MEELSKSAKHRSNRTPKIKTELWIRATIKKLENRPWLALTISILSFFSSLIFGIATNAIYDYTKKEFRTADEIGKWLFFLFLLIVITAFIILLRFVLEEHLRIIRSTLNTMKDRIINSEIRASNKIAQISKTIKAFDSDFKYRLAIKSSYINNNLSKIDAAYIKSLESIQKASSSIKIIGDYSPENYELDTTNERFAYLSEIEDKIKTHIDANLPFTYTRIIQRDLSTFTSIKLRSSEGGGVYLCESDMIGSLQEFEHCKRVYELIKYARSKNIHDVNINILVGRHLPNCPSILLVDGEIKKYMLFTIPTIHNENPGTRYSTGGVLFFEIWNGKYQKAFLRSFDELINSFERHSEQINGIMDK